MTTHATCWKVTRRDTTVEGYTDHDLDLTVGGVTYVSAAGYAPSAVERTSDMSADNQQVVGIIDTDNLDAGDLLNGAYDGARVELFMVDWSTETMVAKLLVGHFGSVRVEDNSYSVDLHSIEAELAKPIGRTFSLRCDAELGDTRCGYALTNDTGAIDSITTQRRVFVDASLAKADGYYDGGKLEWTSGANAGRIADVKRYIAATDTVELYEPMPDDFAVSDAFDIWRGCDKTFETCRDTFSNEINFQGFPYIPGISDVVTGRT